MAESVIEKVKQLTLTITEEEGLDLFNFEFKKSGHRWFLRIFLDKEGGVNLNDCEGVSRKLSAILDKEDLIPHSYILEVSSPGLDRPLLSEKDYAKFKGKNVRIRTSEPINGQKNFRGRLAKYEDGAVTLEIEVRKNETKSVSIPYHNIAKAKLEIDL